MAVQQECPRHAGRQLMLFCGKCIRSYCPTCIIQQPLCPISSHAHEFIELEGVTSFLRSQLKSIETQLRCEQSALLAHVKNFDGESEHRDEEFNGQVERVLQSRDEALQVLQQLQTAIRAAAVSAIANVLRAGVESDGRKQNVEDMHVRSLACMQQSRTITRLNNMNDASLLKEMAFVRNLIRCTEPTPTSTAPPAPAPVDPTSGRQPSASSTCLSHVKESTIESQMQHIVEHAKQLIQSLGNNFHVSSNLTFWCILLESYQYELKSNLIYLILFHPCTLGISNTILSIERKENFRSSTRHQDASKARYIQLP